MPELLKVGFLFRIWYSPATIVIFHEVLFENCPQFQWLLVLLPYSLRLFHINRRQSWYVIGLRKLTTDPLDCTFLVADEQLVLLDFL